MKVNRSHFFTSLLSGVILFVCTNKTSAQAHSPIYQEIAQLDSLQFDAFNTRNLERLMSYFDTSLELYQDNTGVRNYKQTAQAFAGLFTMDYILSRKLVAGSMEVYPIKDYGAIETGLHTFSHVENGQLQTATYKFMQIWQKKDGVWKVTHEITYGH